MKNRKYTDEQFIEAVKNNFTIRGVLKSLRLAPAGGSYKIFYRSIKSLNIDISHFTGKAHLKGKPRQFSIPNKIPLTEILIVNSTYTCTSSLRKRLIKEEYLENICSECGINEWRGVKLSLHLDHIDGNNINNQIENLRLLCPNCHSLTSTYCGKNKGKQK